MTKPGFYIVSSWFLAETAASWRKGGRMPDQPGGSSKGVHHDGLEQRRRNGFAQMAWYGRVGVFWLVLLGLIVWLVVRLLPDSGNSNSPARGTGDSALDILDRRLANGQLDLPSWQAQRAALQGVQDVRK